jgi:hypothetical protein
MSAGRSTNMHSLSAVHRAYYGEDQRRADKIKERERKKFCPQLDRLIYGKKYVLPNYRQGDYYDQHLNNKLYSASLLRPLETQEFDDVTNAAFSNAVQALKCGRPQLWLERELGEAFMRTQLPEDMSSEDVKWRWPGFRVHLPKGILAITGEVSVHEAGQLSPVIGRTPLKRDLMYLDVCSIPATASLHIPEPYASEIVTLTTELGWHNPQSVYSCETTRYHQRALMIAGNLSGEPDGQMISNLDFMIYAVVKPFDEAVKLGQIRRITSEDGDLSSPYEITVVDNEFCERMLHLALNILLYLGSTPLEYQPEEVLRKPRLEGKHSLPGLYRARFVGASQLRPSKAAHTAGPVTGRHLPQHWRAGTWKRQPFGPKSSLRKLIWVMPYQTTGVGYEPV